MRTLYYQQILGCQILSSRVKPSLALEWVGPGKGKVSGSLRLPARLPTFYDSGFFDILFPEALTQQERMWNHDLGGSASALPSPIGSATRVGG